MGVELLSRIREAARGLPALLGVKARAVIVFGSAARPEDFVPGLSDVDVLIISEGEPKQRRYCLELLGHRFEVSVLKLEEVLKAFEEGDPLAHMLSRGIFAYDDGVSRLLP
ncbi:MAG: nucleotidyltransferase domain-containing protein, partial [Desulfurococcaceae archaeon]